MSLAPKDWKPGMTVESDRGGNRAVLIEPTTEPGITHAWKANGVEGYSPGRWLNADCFRVLTYADLSREPVEGERAVRVESDFPDLLGKVYEWEGGRWTREGITTIIAHRPANFAPLSHIHEHESHEKSKHRGIKKRSLFLHAHTF